MRSPRLSRALRPAVALAAAALVVAGCGGTDDTSDTAQASDTAAVSEAADAATGAAVTVTDPWVVATGEGRDNSMTAAFGVLTNDSDTDLTVVSATNTVSDRTELHEMAMVDGAMVMRPVAGGITVPAGGSTVLEPGGLHVMIMDVDSAVSPGASVGVTLTLSDGSTVAFDALVKEFAGANEEYDGGDAGEMDMDMGGQGSATDGS